MAREHAIELRNAGVYDSYVEYIAELNRHRKTLDDEYAGARYRKLGQLQLDTDTWFELDPPLLAFGLDREGILARHRTIAQLAIAKVDPETGSYVLGTYSGPVAEGHDRSFVALHPYFAGSTDILRTKATELQAAHLYVSMPPPSE
jgi:hypothetical protein